MKLLDIINTGKDRIESVENFDTDRRKSKRSLLLGNLKSLFRGGTLGAVAGALVGDGKPEYILIGAYAGSMIDMLQNTTRTFGLMLMKIGDPGRYNIHKEKYYSRR